MSPVENYRYITHAHFVTSPTFTSVYHPHRILRTRMNKGSQEVIHSVTVIKKVATHKKRDLTSVYHPR